MRLGQSRKLFLTLALSAVLGLIAFGASWLRRPEVVVSLEETDADRRHGVNTCETQDVVVKPGENPAPAGLGSSGGTGECVMEGVGAPSQAATRVELEADQSHASTAASRPDILVHVAGAVAHPGVYRLSQGSRVADALATAGGHASDADMDGVNLALPISDGQQVYIPRKLKLADSKSKSEQVSAAPVLSAQQVPPNRADITKQIPDGSDVGRGESKPRAVNINNASVAELDELPGIGPALAGRIVQYREEFGPFAVPEDIMNVSGIGPAKFEKMKPFVVVR